MATKDNVSLVALFSHQSNVMAQTVLCRHTADTWIRRLSHSWLYVYHGCAWLQSCCECGRQALCLKFCYQVRVCLGLPDMLLSLLHQSMLWPQWHSSALLSQASHPALPYTYLSTGHWHTTSSASDTQIPAKCSDLCNAFFIIYVSSPSSFCFQSAIFIWEGKQVEGAAKASYLFRDTCCLWCMIQEHLVVLLVYISATVHWWYCAMDCSGSLGEDV